MTNKIKVQKIMEIVKQKQLNDGTGHDWWHTLRVYHNALDIAKHEKNVNIFIVELGALFHDFADHKFGFSDEDREDIIKAILSDYDILEKDIDKVVYIANHISFKGGTNTKELAMIEAKIVQDADRLDAIGAIGIGRVFTYGGHKGRVMYNPEQRNNHLPSLEKSHDTIEHFYDKLLRLKDLMNTDYGRKKSEQRHLFMEQFLNRFYKEWQGKD